MLVKKPSRQMTSVQPFRTFFFLPTVEQKAHDVIARVQKRKQKEKEIDLV